jgi:hypothetical protein
MDGVLMPAFQQNGTVYVVHSNYYYNSISSQPFAPQNYWNVITHDGNIIPVVTQGYRSEKSAKQKIIQNVKAVKECVLLHVETKEEHMKLFDMHMTAMRRLFTDS